MFVWLSEVTHSDKPLEDTLVNLVGAQRSKAFCHWVWTRLETGRCVVLLDAWDELPSDQQQRVGQWLAVFAQRFPRLRLLLTSRLFGYAGSPIPGAQELELLPLDMPQVETFVRTWFGNSGATANQLLEGLHQPLQLQEVAGIPLMLMLMCRAHHEKRCDTHTHPRACCEYCLRGLLWYWKAEWEQRDISGAYVDAVLELLDEVIRPLFANGRTSCSEVRLGRKIQQWLGRQPPFHELRKRNAIEPITELARDGVLIAAYGACCGSGSTRSQSGKLVMPTCRLE